MCGPFIAGYFNKQNEICPHTLKSKVVRNYPPRILSTGVCERNSVKTDCYLGKKKNCSETSFQSSFRSCRPTARRDEERWSNEGDPNGSDYRLRQELWLQILSLSLLLFQKRLKTMLLIVRLQLQLPYEILNDAIIFSDDYVRLVSPVVRWL